MMTALTLLRTKLPDFQIFFCSPIKVIDPVKRNRFYSNLGLSIPVVEKNATWSDMPNPIYFRQNPIIHFIKEF